MIMEQYVTTFSATGRQPKETCKQCRFRKVRCDGKRGDKGCGDCDRLKFSCSFVTPLPPPTPTSTTEGEPSDHPSPTSDRPVERRRTSKACIACRQHKVLVESYFAHVYPLSSYAFLHPQTTIRQCSSGQLENSLSYAIAAVASYHQGSPGRREEAELSWAQAAEDLIWKSLESPSVSRLQALLLVILYRVETGAFQRAFMLSALAARAAAAMRLNHERDGSTGNRTSREVRRRVMWSLKLVERYFSTGLPEFELCPVESIYLELPCWEQEFSDTRADSSERTLQSCDFGSYHLCVRLEMLRRDLMKLNRSLSLCDTAFPQLSTVMHDFEQHLTRIGAELPGGPTLTAERISSLLDSPWLPRQILVHLSFHHSQCDLYRLLVRNYREAAPAAVLDAVDPSLLARAEQLCLQHATAIVDILATLNQVSHKAQPLEFDTAICGYHATRLLLFIAQSSTPSQPPGGGGSSSSSSSSRPSEEWALSRAELCLAALRRFFPSSRLARPVLEEMKRAISVFPTKGGAAASSSPVPGRLASPGPTTTTRSGARDSTAGLSAAARVRQRLAIHSLLRQADFPDGDEQPSSPEDTRRGSPSSGGGGATTTASAAATTASHILATAAAVADKAPSPRLPGIAALEIPRVPPSTGFILSPRRTSSSPSPSERGGGVEAEPWQSGWVDGGVAADRWDSPKTQQAGGGGVGPPSFSFPWLQRWEGTNAIAGKMMG
ncbi:putative mucin-desulfating sulfatase (n-acetylglucosamine-6-sulfatase) [Diaporthe ampelina]|uniref:Putative mucin-desulfating sulfatase (N-acetylglucosamine-6-sulfatase) n=1 Tax=Diaporthe ampelina TaxID=1214573 RepID=A0A0G2HZD1_9PEZI|nr:putative mucin-desulfating sulfatase (n-acetylglucosamine-6-sulfatase) [Diaporthe ampelina]